MAHAAGVKRRRIGVSAGVKRRRIGVSAGLRALPGLLRRLWQGFP